MSSPDWPPEYDRTPSEERTPYPHGFDVSRSKAFESILAELGKMDGVTDVQLDSGAEHQTRNPNKPYANASFDDPGVVVRFRRDGEQFAMPMDRWDNPRDNARAIALTLRAKRALTRYGVETIESEFETLRLPPGDPDREAVAGRQPPHDVLGVAPDADPDVVKAAARSLKKKHHPDHGGDRETFLRIVRAESELLEGSR